MKKRKLTRKQKAISWLCVLLLCVLVQNIFCPYYSIIPSLAARHSAYADGVIGKLHHLTTIKNGSYKMYLYATDDGVAISEVNLATLIFTGHTTIKYCEGNKDFYAFRTETFLNRQKPDVHLNTFYGRIDNKDIDRIVVYYSLRDYNSESVESDFEIYKEYEITKNDECKFCEFNGKLYFALSVETEFFPQKVSKFVAVGYSKDGTKLCEVEL